MLRESSPVQVSLTRNLRYGPSAAAAPASAEGLPAGGSPAHAGGVTRTKVVVTRGPAADAPRGRPPSASPAASGAGGAAAAAAAGRAWH